MTLLFQEDWTGSNGTAWNATRWPTIAVTSTSIVDIQSNQGRLVPQGAAFATARALSSSGNIPDLDLTVLFTLGASGVEQYHGICVRHTNAWTGNVPTDGYRILVFDGSLALTVYTASVQGLNVAPAKTWNTSQWNLRIRCEGTAVKVKAWQGGEPGTWDIEETDSNHTTGIASFVSLNGSTATARPIQWDSLLVNDLATGAKFIMGRPE